MSVEVLEARESDKETLRNLLQLYVYDLSEVEGFDVDSHGCFCFRWLDHYWTEEGRHPYLISVDGQWAGFVLVNQHMLASDDGHSIAEFFIMRKYRRRGIGGHVARRIFRMFPGRWEVRQAEGNTVAQSFWRKVIGEMTAGAYEEIDGVRDRTGPIQVFEVEH